MALSLFVGGAAADDDQEAKLRKAVATVLPDVEITEIAPAPVPGLYEVMLGPSVLYVSADGRYIVKGDIFDLSSLDNITSARRAAARVEAFESLAEDDTIEFAPPEGKTKRVLYVYTDIDCGYCRKMHQEIGTLNDAGIAVRYLAYPRTGIGGESYKKAVAVWCSKDRQTALTESKLGKKVEAANCPNPVSKLYQLGEAMGVRGTPAVYSDDGESLGGYVPAPELIRLLFSTEG